MIFMQQMQYNKPNRMYVFQNFSGVTPPPPNPFLCCDPESGPLPSKILAALQEGADMYQFAHS